MEISTCMLNIKGLAKSYGSKNVLKDFSMSFDKGHVYGLLGKNGAGKTTLIRIIMGIIPPDAGCILFDGFPVDLNRPAYRQKIGYIPEDPFFYRDMKVRELLYLNSCFFKKWNRNKAANLCRAFGLVEETRIRNMSRGMKLKLGFVVALAQDLELLILDDPTSGLDVCTRRDVLVDLIREISDSGTTVLFASHQIHELEGLIDHVFVLHNGNILIDESYSLLKESMRRVTLTFDSPPKFSRLFEGQLTSIIRDREVEFICKDLDERKVKELKNLQPRHMDVQALSLEEMFLAWVEEAPGRE